MQGPFLLTLILLIHQTLVLKTSIGLDYYSFVAGDITRVEPNESIALNSFLQDFRRDH